MGWIKDKLERLFCKHSPSRTAIDAIKENWDAYQEGFERGLRNAEGARLSIREFRDTHGVDRELIDEIKEQLRG